MAGIQLHQYRLKLKHYRDFSAKTEQVTLCRPQEGKNVELSVNEEHYEISRIASAFPLSSALEAIVFYDTEGEEIGLLKHADSLDSASHSLLQEELEKAYFMPRIQAILSMEENLGVENWKVVTNKGERSFQVRHPRRSVRKVGKACVVINDVDSNRYEIPDWRRLDQKSINLLINHL